MSPDPRAPSAAPRSLATVLVRARHGARIGWHGVDIFHFDAAGQITGKYTYAAYTRPRLERALDVPL